MPFSILLNMSPQTDVPVAHVQGSALQGMFLHLMQQIDPAVSAQLHDEAGYRPFTLSPLGVYNEVSRFQGFWLPGDTILSPKTACYVRVTLLDDALFSVFNQYFQSVSKAIVTLAETEFVVTDMLNASDTRNEWSRSSTYPELIDQALRHQRKRKLRLRFMTPTSFSQGKIDLPLPLPRLVFQSYKKRFERFYQVTFLPDFEKQVEYAVGISNLKQIKTAVIQTKKVKLIGFTGEVVFSIHSQAPPELVFQLNLLADFSFFCGTGKKTTVGMGQTIRIDNYRSRSPITIPMAMPVPTNSQVGDPCEG